MECRLGDGLNSVETAAYGSLHDLNGRSDAVHDYVPDFNNFTDQANLTCAQHAYIDVLKLSFYALKAVEQDTLMPSYFRYFNASELQDVQKVYSAILGPQFHGSPLVEEGRLHVNYKETMTPPEEGPNPCDSNVSAWFRQLEFGGNQSQIVLCPAMFLEWHTPCVADAIACENVGSYASRGWDSMASVMLHEFAHWAGTMDANVGFVAGDWQGDDTTSYPTDGYGPYNAMMVNVMARGGSRNADNYKVFAQEAYYHQRCNSPNFSDPPNPNSPVGRREVQDHTYTAL